MNGSPLMPAVAAACMALFGCNSPESGWKPDPKPKALDIVESNRIKDTALSIAASGSAVIASCGQSVGIGFYSDKGWTEDRVDGQFAITKTPNGLFDVIFSSELSGFASAIKDGGIVRYMPAPSGSDFSIIVEYPSTGIIESHLFNSGFPTGKAISTALKPTLDILPPRGRVLVSSCFISPRSEWD